MVYCGKASLGCSSCRKRRIKCDRRQPECTQCVRLSKACPGYRDQLSLMFRDETVKVEKRVRASWGMNDSSSGAVSSSPSSSSKASRTIPAKSSKSISPSPSDSSSSSESIPTPPASIESNSPRSANSKRKQSASPPPFSTHAEAKQQVSLASRGVCTPAPPYIYSLGSSPVELGISFYVEHFIIGYPDEARNPADLNGQLWFKHPSAQATMAALGLAALGNLNGDKQLQRLSKIKYGEALVCTNEALQDPVKNLESAIRTTIMLALFQCVHTTHESHENARVHLLGCMALIKSALPIRNVPANGIRGVLQLCYSLLIPCIRSGVPMPENFSEWLQDPVFLGFLPDSEQPAVELILVLSQFVSLSAMMRSTVFTGFTDGREAIADVMRQLLALDAALDHWEVSQTGKWLYETHHNDSLPPEAAYRGNYHRYEDVWTSRIWNHFRWGRLLANQLLLECAERYPTSAAGVVSATQRDKAYETSCRLAVDLCTSVPTHYKHPKLTWEHLDTIQTHGSAGAGVVGVPHLMFHLQVAACAPGLPFDVWKWAVDVMETAWRELGMLHAKSLAEVSRKHRTSVEVIVPAKVFKVEPGLEDCGWVHESVAC